MKFYYKGELVRSSKNHVYSHAALFDGEVVSCSSSYELARKALGSYLSRLEANIGNYKLAVAAIDRGERSYWTKDKFRVKIEWSKDEYLSWIADCEERKKKYEIVELEAR